MRRTRSRFVLEVDGAGVEAVAQVGGAAQVDGSAQVGGNLVTTGAARRSPRKLGGHHGGVKPPVMHTVAHRRYIVLAVLVVQNTSLVLMMRASRTAMIGKQDALYTPSTAVLMMELLKLLCCLALFARELHGSALNLGATLWREVAMKPMEVLRLAVPSLLYSVQNNLLYVALSNLDAASYQVTYQLKILTTALFSVLLFGRQLSARKWFALVLLTAGVVLVQMQGSAAHHKSSSGGLLHKVNEDARNTAVGLLAVLVACLLSGFSGCYFEWILKGSPRSKVSTCNSLWLRNIQMGVSSVWFALGTMLVNDYESLLQRGLFHGYSPMIWTVIANQAFGGLIVAMVVRDADSILKGFATSASIILSGAISVVLLDFQPSSLFLGGSLVVIASVYLYSLPGNGHSKAKR